jgi:hypothetical protein
VRKNLSTCEHVGGFSICFVAVVVVVVVAVVVVVVPVLDKKAITQTRAITNLSIQ